MFSGWLPTEIGNLTNLYYLQLFSNSFSGKLPTEIAKCTGSSISLSDSDCQEWQALYNSTVGSSWNHCSGNRLDPCSCSYNDSMMRGVTCNSTSNMITMSIYYPFRNTNGVDIIRVILSRK